MSGLHIRDQIKIISYPKCGRTWLRLILGEIFAKHYNVMHPSINKFKLELEPLACLHPDIPKIALIHDDHPQWKKPHELSKDKSEYENCKIIFLVRDPRDVIVSLYFEHRERVKMYSNYLSKYSDMKPYFDRVQTYCGTLKEFVYEDIGGIDTIITFYNIWAEESASLDMMPLAYEDMKTNTTLCINRVLDFIGISSVPIDTICHAVALTSFEKMRAAEINNLHDSFILQPTDYKDFETYKTRRGVVGGYTDYLQPAEVQYLNAKIRENLNPCFHY